MEPAPLPWVPHVLVVDDHRAVANLCARLLQAWGYQPVIAHDGPSALQTAQTQQPDAILLDIGSPGVGGPELVRRLRMQPGLEKVLLVTMSGDGTPGDAGVGPHLMKPFRPEALQLILARALPDGSPAGSARGVPVPS
jgi:CheY-like chemotaxis protein